MHTLHDAQPAKKQAQQHSDGPCPAHAGIKMLLAYITHPAQPQQNKTSAGMRTGQSPAALSKHLGPKMGRPSFISAKLSQQHGAGHSSELFDRTYKPRPRKQQQRRSEEHT